MGGGPLERLVRNRLPTLMNPRRFLLLAGPALILIGSSGIVGVLGSLSSASFFHPPAWINWVHLSVGLAALGLGLFGRPKLQAVLVLVPALLGTLFGVLGLLFGRLAAARFGISALADPSDHLAHLTVGLAAGWAWLNRPR